MRFAKSARYLTVGTLLVFGTALSLQSNAGAHVLRQGNGISALLHIPPIDQPRAGETTDLYVSFGDKNKTFNLQNCRCTVAIEKEDKVLTKLPLKPTLPGATQEGMVTYTFPSVGTYDLAIEGSAVNGQFSKFALPYDVQIASDINVSSTMHKRNINPEIAMISAGLLLGIAVFAVAGARDSGRYRKK